MKLVDLRPKKIGADMRGVCQLGALLNLLPVIPDGTPTSTYDVTDTAFKVISSVSTNSSTVVELEYGTASGVYTNTVTAAESPVLATGDVNFSLTGLTPFTNYYFRVKAVNSAGTAYSQEFVQKTAEPAIISDGNTVAWYDYTAADTITKDGSNFVSQWRSRIGSNHLNQAIGTNQPLLTDDGVLFDGIDNFMTTNAFTFNQPGYIYFVADNKVHKENAYLFCGNTFNARFIQRIVNQFQLAAGTDLNGTINNSYAKKQIYRIAFNGVNSFFKIMGNAISGNAGTNAIGGIRLGYNTATIFTNIEFCELIARKVADNSNDENEIYNYLKNKYGL